MKKIATLPDAIQPASEDLTFAAFVEGDEICLRGMGDHDGSYVIQSIGDDGELTLQRSR